MSWLLRDGEVLAAIDPPVRRWPDSIQGALVRRGPVLVHTLGSSRGLDVAWCVSGRDEDGQACLDVRRIAGLRPRRLGWPQLGRGYVVAAEQGAFERWHLGVGDRLRVRDA